MHVSDFFQSHVFGGYCFWNQFVAFVDFVGLLVYELQISINALNIQLKDLNNIFKYFN